MSVHGERLYSGDAENLVELLERAVKARANLENVNLAYELLYNANLAGANLAGANLSNAYLAGANLAGADLRNANLQWADLAGASLPDCKLNNADFRNASLRYGSLVRSALVDANFSRADLSGANLGDTNLTDANFRDANLCGINLSGFRDPHIGATLGLNRYRAQPLLMLLDQPDRIRAYKLVTDAGSDPFSGHLCYVGGEFISVCDADTDESKEWAAGIRVSTLDWAMREWKPSYRILVVEFAAADIACIPIASDGQFRLHRCTVVAEKALASIGLGE